MIDHSEYGAVIQISYGDDIVPPGCPEYAQFVIETEQRFRYALEEELSDKDGLWTAHAKDLHMWYYDWVQNKTAGEECFDEEGAPKCVAHTWRMKYLVDMWQECALKGKDKEAVFTMDVDITSIRLDLNVKDVVDREYRVDAVKFLYVLVVNRGLDGMDEESENDGDEEASANGDECSPPKLCCMRK
jgi:hypothetical protein